MRRPGARARALITQLVVSVAWMWISRLTSQPCSATARTIRRRGPPAHCESNLGLPTMHSLVSQTNAIHGSRIASVAQRPAVVLQRSMTSIRHGCRPSLHVTRLRAMPFCTFDSHRSSCPSVRSAQQLPSSQLIRTFSNARRVKQRRSPAEKLQREIVVPELCTIGRLASILEVSAEGLLQTADAMGESVPSEAMPLSRELLELLALEHNATLKIKMVDVHRAPRPPPDVFEALPLRPPVVTLMGHVDHGKTSLLDAFRGSKVAEGEAGGITQGISAFIVDPGTPRAITFIDTPGHELFAAMRQRGATATDLILLVVAIESGVQDTTREAIRYALDSGTPLVVAANKADKAGADEQIEKLKQQLLQEGVMLEGMGGEVPLVPVSATKRMNLDELRDTLLLQAELLELHAPPTGRAEGVVIEATVHKGLGHLTTALVQSGRLKVGDHVVVGTTYGKVRVLQDESGNKMSEALPSTPVRFSGLKDLPSSGDELIVVESEKRAREVSEFRSDKLVLEREAAASQRRGRRVRNVIQVPVVIKADSQGSLEAVKEGLAHYPTSLVELSTVRAAVGAFSEGDIQLAASVKADMIGFNVPISKKLDVLATQAGVTVRSYDVIYKLVDGVKEVLEAKIPPAIDSVATGKAEVQEVFQLTLNRKDRREGMFKKTFVAGSRVVSGQAAATSKVAVMRGEEQLYDGHVISLKHFKQEVKTLKKGAECGIILHEFGEFEKGDMIVFYEHVPRKINLYDSEEDQQGRKVF
uniref:Translation initiation factor IF-2, mitochondrial n=1 Tax=Chrysotila carterae TaxID=13221 RepID=A0A7S4B675_CHRCT